MHTPALLPDELVGGYLERMARLNGLASGREVLQRLLNQPGRRRGPSACPTALELVAKATKVEKAHLIQAHTLIPLTKLVGRGHATAPYGAPKHRRSERLALSQTLDPGAWRCPECVSEDIHFWGFPYERRSANLPGIDWCTKHGLQLTRRASVGHESTNRVIELTPFERRYAEILETLLEHPHPVPMHSAVHSLCLRARDLGMGWRMFGANVRLAAPKLSQLAMASTPEGWEKRHRKLQTEWRYSDIGKVLRRPVVPHEADMYAFALTVMFDSADAACSAFLQGYCPEDLKELARRARRESSNRARPGYAQPIGARKAKQNEA